MGDLTSVSLSADGELLTVHFTAAGSPPEGQVHPTVFDHSSIVIWSLGLWDAQGKERYSLDVTYSLSEGLIGGVIDLTNRDTIDGVEVETHDNVYTATVPLDQLPLLGPEFTWDANAQWMPTGLLAQSDSPVYLDWCPEPPEVPSSAQEQPFASALAREVFPDDDGEVEISPTPQDTPTPTPSAETSSGVLHPDALADVPFGTDKDAALSELEALFGKPDSEGPSAACGAPEIEIVWGGLSVYFNEKPSVLVGYRYYSDEELTTNEGVTNGTTVGDAKAIYGDEFKVFDNGTFVIGDPGDAPNIVHGYVTGTTSADTISGIKAGAVCGNF